MYGHPAMSKPLTCGTVICLLLDKDCFSTKHTLITCLLWDMWPSRSKFLHVHICSLFSILFIMLSVSWIQLVALDFPLMYFSFSGKFFILLTRKLLLPIKMRLLAITQGKPPWPSRIRYIRGSFYISPDPTPLLAFLNKLQKGMPASGM